MKADQLKQALKKIIREEVRRAVSEEVNKSMAKILAEILNNTSSSNTRPTVVEKVSVPKKKYTSNEKINEVLNDTTSDLKLRDIEAGIIEKFGLGDEFSKIGIGESAITPSSNTDVDMSSKMNMIKSIVGKEPIGQQSSVLDVANSTPIASVFKKDFRSMLKKMDKIKKGSGGMSFFNPGSIPMASSGELDQMPSQ